MTQASPLFRPFRIGSLTLPNRILMAPMSRYHCPQSVPTEESAAYYARRAAGGVGLILSEASYIGHPSAPSSAGVPNFHGEAALAGWAKVLAAVRAAGGLMFPQLWHSGSYRELGMGPDPSVPGFGPSANLNAFNNTTHPTKPMDQADIDAVIAAYADAAAAARSIGFDGVELLAAHGVLIDEFFWEVTNRRIDRYGGSPKNRTRFAVEVISAIRDRVGPDFPISFRLSQWKQYDYAAKIAATPAELAMLLEPLADAGVTLFHCSMRRFWVPEFPHDALTLAGWVKKLTGIATIAVGSVGLDSIEFGQVGPAGLEELERRMDQDEFDLIAVGRALIADPEWVLKVREGRLAACRGFSKECLNILY
jgi:2,4-dienoyl-CoA reductase-like NADH-dependent reductase (Old Yellow Enzyme family)